MPPPLESCKLGGFIRGILHNLVPEEDGTRLGHVVLT